MSAWNLEGDAFLVFMHCTNIASLKAEAMGACRYVCSYLAIYIYNRAIVYISEMTVENAIFPLLPSVNKVKD